MIRPSFPTRGLMRAVAAVAPVAGVSVGDPLDRATWRVDFDPAATLAEREAAAGVLATFDPSRPPVPVSVAPSQARRALRAAGLLAAVEAAVAAAGDEVQIAWEYGLEVRRDSPMIAALVQAVGLTGQEIDDLFVTAGGIA